MNESEQAQTTRYRAVHHLNQMTTEHDGEWVRYESYKSIVDSQAQKIAASATVIDEMHAHTVTLNALYLQAENKIAEQAKEIERLRQEHSSYRQTTGE